MNLRIIIILAILTAVLSVPFLLYNWIKYTVDQREFKNHRIQTAPNFPIRSVGFFLVPIFVAMIISQFTTTTDKNNIATFFQQLPEEHQVYVNKTPARNAEQVISMLRTVKPYWAHHSHPTKRINIDIVSPENKLSLELRRDSDVPQEYWVFYTGESGLESEIGRVTTSLFDEF